LSFSQNNEEAVILDYFGEYRGRFLDVGAFGFKELSNTRQLAELGWDGVLVEPNPEAFAALLANCPPAAFPNVKAVCAAVMPEPGLVDFAIGWAVSTAVPAHRARWQGQVTYRDITVCGVTPWTLLEHCPPPYDVFSLDVEGLNLPLLERFPLNAMGLQCLCVEHDGRQDRVRELAGAAGLGREIYHSAENLILCK
jgi:FkbM family methyltransferase